MKKQQFYLFFFSFLLHETFGSFCGRTGVPFSFEVLPSGAPVLGCAQPTCIGSLKGKKDDSNFLINAKGQVDGFMRGDEKDNKAYSDPYGNKLVANCSGQFSDLSCLRKDQWVGGIEYIDHPRQPLILQCCTFPGLRFSQEVGVTNVGPGEAITGGEVIRDGRQISFDVIANARKVVDANTHIVSYEVTVRRMHCLPDPPEPVVNFEKDVGDEIVKVLAKGTDLSAFRKDKTIRKEKLEELQSRKAFTDITSRKNNEKKQYKKTEFEEKESFKTIVHNTNEAFQKPYQTDPRIEIAPKLHSPIHNYKLDIGSYDDRNTFPTQNNPGFSNTQVVQTVPKAFGQPQLNLYGQQSQQSLPIQQPGFGFGQIHQHVPSQIIHPGSIQPKQIQPGQIQSGQIQPGQSHSNNPPCGAPCQQPSILGLPTLFPLNFPTLPSFPTLAPHTFQPFFTQTYPTIAPIPAQSVFQPVPGYVDPSNSVNAVSINSPAYYAATNNRRHINSNGRIPISPILHTASTPIPDTIPAQTPAPLYGSPVLLSGNQALNSQVTLRPLPTFEEFMARLGYHNLSLATLPPPGPLIFPPNFTVVTPLPPFPPSLHTQTSSPPNQIQLFNSGVGIPQSQPDPYRYYYALASPQQRSATNSDDTVLQRTRFQQQ